MALTLEAFKVSIATTKTLLCDPFSTNQTYLLPEAKSSVCFALPFDQNLINPTSEKWIMNPLKLIKYGPLPLQLE
jgi:epoxyqueuosine reductase QueG